MPLDPGRNAAQQRRQPVPDVWSMPHPVLYTLIRVAIILAVFVPMSIRQYRRGLRSRLGVRLTRGRT
jgi:hypothetical protein